jgi:DNA-binding SARP family transcriptional activator
MVVVVMVVADVGVVDVRGHGRPWVIQLLGGFELHGPDGVVEVTLGVQRLLAFIALHGGSVPRARAARELWPEVPGDRAAANLRSALWRARRIGPLVQPGVSVLRLGPGVRVDVAELSQRPEDRADHDLAGSGARGFNLELLPDWTEDWVTFERERLRQVELQLLDDTVEDYVSRGRVGDALDAALRAIRLEPLRESSHQALIRIFLGSGNRSAALSHYQGFVALLRDELDLGPDPATTALVQPYLSPRRPHGVRTPSRRPPAARRAR